MKRILLVAYYFPPINLSGSMRPLGFCRYLEQYGWMPQVVTTNWESLFPPISKDPGLASLVPSNVIINRIPHPNPGQAVIEIRELVRKKLDGLLGERSLVNRGQSSHVDLKSNDNKFKSWQVSVKDFIWNWLFSFPDPQMYWLREVERKIPKIKQDEASHAIWATGRPWTALLLGMKLAQKYGVPFIADFRDPWFESSYSQPVAPGFMEKTKKLERSIFVAATKVITTTPELSNWFKLQYPELKEKFEFITNGFDGNDTTGPVSNENERMVTRDLQPLEICHFGSIYGKRHPIFLFQALLELIEEKIIQPEQIRLKFVGEWVTGVGEEVAKELESIGILARAPGIPHAQCLQEMRLADILLILQPDAPLQIPGKLYEYVSMGKPILVVGDSGATSALIDKHQLGRWCPNSLSSLKQLLVGLISRKDQISPPPTEVVGQFHYRFLTKQLVSILDSIC